MCLRAGTSLRRRRERGRQRPKRQQWHEHERRRHHHPPTDVSDVRRAGATAAALLRVSRRGTQRRRRRHASAAVNATEMCAPWVCPSAESSYRRSRRSKRGRSRSRSRRMNSKSRRERPEGRIYTGEKCKARAQRSPLGAAVRRTLQGGLPATRERERKRRVHKVVQCAGARLEPGALPALP